MEQEKVIAKKPKPPKIATIVSIIYTILGCVICFLALKAETGSFIKYCSLCYPIVGLIVMTFSFGRIKFLSNVSRGQSPGIFIGFALPASILLYDSLFNYNLLRYSDLLIPGGVTIIALFLVLYFAGFNRKAEKPLLQGIIMLICTTVYSIGLITNINCQFDESPPMKFNTVVESKFISESKGKKHYKLTLTSWERGQDSKQIEVTQNEYEQTPVDGPVGGHIKSGYLHIRWFYLDL